MPAGIIKNPIRNGIRKKPRKRKNIPRME